MGFNSGFKGLMRVNRWWHSAEAISGQSSITGWCEDA